MKIVECISWLWRISEGWRLKIVLNTLSGTARVALSLLFVWLSKRLVDIATGQVDGALSLYFIMMAVCMLAQLTFLVVKSRIEAKTIVGVKNKVTFKIFNHLMISRWTGKDRFHTGDVLNRLEGDVASVTELLGSVIPNVVSTAIQLLGATWFLAKMEPILAIVLLVMMPLMIALSKTFIFNMRRLNNEIRDTDSRLQTYLQENLQHRSLISSLEYTSHASDELSSMQNDLHRKYMARNDYALFSRTMVQLGFLAGYVAVMFWSVLGLKNGTITFGMMTAFLQLVSQVQRPVVDLSRQIPALVRVLTSVERLCELMNVPEEEQGEPVKLSGLAGVRMRGVDFSYPDSSSPVLSDFSCDFRPGSMTAVIGETGSGKSTMIRLILALLLPNKGDIRFYNDFEEVQASPLTRCNIVYVPQGNTLLSGTIRDNLLIGCPEATEEQLLVALHSAVADFVLELPDGLDTVCGELGAGLSEGQAQRIAIARGLLRPGSIMILDEPTSALDPETEKILISRLGQYAGDKTVIIVTHREALTSLCSDSVRLNRT